MNEKTTLEIIAPTVEEAIAQGLAQLGLSADAVSVEVLDAGTKGLFGLGRHQVRVHLTVVPPGGIEVIKADPVPSSKPEARATNQTQAKPAPVISSTASRKEPELPLEHDPLLDHTESVVSKMLHLLNLEAQVSRSEEHTSELQSRLHLVCRLLLEKKNIIKI